MKKLIIVALIVLNTLLATARSISLNDGWFFGQDPSDGLKAVNLPHSWNSDAYVKKDYSKGKYYYRRYLNLQPSDSTRNFYLRLEGASKSSEVSVNGTPAGHHEGGYTESIYNITPFLSFSEPNLIEIAVDNSRDDIPPISGDFTFFGGIYRDVWLEDYPDLHLSLIPFASQGINVTSSLVMGQVMSKWIFPSQMKAIHIKTPL